MDNRFTTMLKAVETAGAQFSVTYSNDADNAAVLTELAVDLVDALRSLVWSAGADMDYFDTAKDDFLLGIDQAFSDQAEINKIIKSRQMHLDAERARLAPLAHNSAARLEYALKASVKGAVIV